VTPVEAMIAGWTLLATIVGVIAAALARGR
jgi:hypothetical protein